ncbi:MAG: helix-turn-helix transcriptional regulator [Pseudomonadota bacterium]
MTGNAQIATQDFRSVCRQWRRYRKLSQLELALAANVSQRHVSWLETGRSKPSREMVVRLSEALDIPLRDRNVLLRAAGFAPAYSESQLDAPAMAPVLEALQHVLRHHEPFPAVVVDRFWNVRMKNAAMDFLFGLVGDPQALLEAVGDDGNMNLALLSLHPKGLRRYIANFDRAAAMFVNRLKREAVASGDAELQRRFAEIIALADGLECGDYPGPEVLPVLPLELAVGGARLSVFSVISTFGTPQDITADELRIEAFYPADEASARVFRERDVPAAGA